MTKHFVIGAAVATAWAGAASAQQLKGLVPAHKPAVAHVRALDLRISAESLPPAPRPFDAGMILSSEVAPNAMLGLGLANLGRTKTGGAGHSRKPAIRFIMRF